MDIALAVALFILLIVAPVLWRSQKRTKRQVAETIIVILFLGWLLLALRACLR